VVQSSLVSIALVYSRNTRDFFSLSKASPSGLRDMKVFGLPLRSQCCRPKNGLDILLKSLFRTQEARNAGYSVWHGPAEDQDVCSQIDAEVCAVEALSLASRLSQLTTGIRGCPKPTGFRGCPKPTGFRVTLKSCRTQQHGPAAAAGSSRRCASTCMISEKKE